jgi:hypothetical protein
LREETARRHLLQTSFPIRWKWDRASFTSVIFKGYEAGRKASEVSGLPRLFYDRNKPYEKEIPFYNTYTDTIAVQKPTAYIIPQGWWKVIDRLNANGIYMQRLKKDTIIDVEVYRIESYQSGDRPYEGHHPNRDTKVSKTVRKVSFRKGDYYIPLAQKGTRFLVEVLEPQGEDSYFAWNFFDTILGQKEGFSDYVFEETAAAYLQKNPAIKEALDKRRVSDSAFAKNANAQLNFVYQHSTYYEPAHNEYPVYRVR